MILTGSDIALGLEAAEALHLQRQVETYGRLTGAPSARAIPACGGIAAVTEPLFGRKLNHVTGLGMGEPVTDAALQALEHAYAQLGLATEVDLCPHADGSALAVLARRGYTVNSFSNTYVLPLAQWASPDAPASAVRVEAITDDRQVAFVPPSVQGFSVQATRRPVELLEITARIAADRQDTSLFVARLEGKVAGCAGLAVLDTPAGRIAHLYIASTLPEFRGRGAQSALLRARLVAARQAGCVLAHVTARPANSSARNTERAGFRLAYTKMTFARAA